MRPVYSGPVDPPEPCCTEEPDYLDLGFPKPDIETILDRCTPEELRDLARGGLLAMAELGQETELTDPAEHCAVINEALEDYAPAWLPTITAQHKPSARWWCQVIDVDPADRDKWTPEEEA